jgi:hypothetical protein
LITYKQETELEDEAGAATGCGGKVISRDTPERRRSQFRLGDAGAVTGFVHAVNKTVHLVLKWV